MAIIIKCAGCKVRRQSNTGPCPKCGETKTRFIIDYWPNGRHGTRCQRYLDDAITSLAVAREIDRETKLAIKDRRRPDPGSNPSQYYILFDELIDEYMDDYKLQHRSRINTIRQDKSFNEREQSLRIVAKNIDSKTTIAMFDRHTATAYARKRAGQITRRNTPVTNRTINKELTYVASYLKWCRRDKNFDTPPFHFDRLKHNRPRPIVLSPDEVVRLVNAAEPFYRAFFLCLYTLGFRLSEAQYLKWSDIDDENKTVKTVQKGGTEKLEPLNAWLNAALKDLKKEQAKKPVKSKKKIKRVAHTNTEGYVFFRPETGRPVMDVRRALERAAKKAGIIKRVTPHLLRHSIATHMLSRGENLRTIQHMLGHAQLSTVTFYTHVVTDNIREATEGMFLEMQHLHVNNRNKKENTEIKKSRHLRKSK